LSAWLAQQRGGEVDPWPLPTSVGTEPVLSYTTKSVERMAQASAESSKQIITTDMITRVRSNPRGIWNPPLAVVGVASVTDAEPAVFVHAAEGSTRISTGHHVVGVDYGAPVRAARRGGGDVADRLVEHLRSAKAPLVNWVDVIPLNTDTPPAQVRSIEGKVARYFGVPLLCKAIPDGRSRRRQLLAQSGSR
jgi:hypothetical protein